MPFQTLLSLPPRHAPHWLAATAISFFLTNFCSADDSVQIEEPRFRRMIHEEISRGVPDNPASVPLAEDLGLFSADGSNEPDNRQWGAKYSDVRELSWVNREVIDRALMHSWPTVRTEFEKRMGAETKSPGLRLIYAVIAARAGSERAALELLESRRSGDVQAVNNSIDAIGALLREFGTAAPAWLVDMAIAAIRDERVTTTSEEGESSGWTGGTRISAIAAKSLLYQLGSSRCTTAVPMLIERITKDPRDESCASVLGMIGDDRAKLPLLEALKHEIDQGPRATRNLIRALGELHAREAVPLLLMHLDDDECITALGQIGDDNAIGPIENVVRGRGVSKDEKYTEADPIPHGRLCAARIAQACLDPVNRFSRLRDLLEDRHFDPVWRRYIPDHLAAHPEPPAIRLLLRTIAQDSNGAVTSACIRALAAFSSPEAVDALLESFDVDFSSKVDADSLGDPDYPLEITTALRELTGVRGPASKSWWEKWWAGVGKTLPAAK